MYASTSGEGEAVDWCGMGGDPDMSTMVDRTGRTASTPDLTRRGNRQAWPDRHGDEVCGAGEGAGAPKT